MDQRGADKDRRLANLMRSAQDGDRTAYTRLLGELVPLLRRVVRHQRRMLQPQDVEDLVQDILLSLHAARATYDPKRPFLAWLITIARNRMVDNVRRYARRSANEVAVEQLPETFSSDGANVFATSRHDPEMLRKAMEDLPRGQRQAIEMLKLHEMSLKQAALVSGVSVGALKVAVHRAMRALRKALKTEA